MKSSTFSRMILGAIVVSMLAVATLSAQTPVKMPKNKYKVEDDIKLGLQTDAQVREQFPLISNPNAKRYIQSVGERLVAAIPPEFQQPAFKYRFDLVNASDINAFALPGGPMYVNRGMIEQAKTEGEMAGVMAHEISHVVLRHSTAQLTKQNNPMNQILGIGAQIGGGMLGGQTGAQLGQMVAQGYFLKYSRDYETQADILGARIMAAAGYDPRDLANMFQTIEKQSGGGGGAPEWLSSHPNPGNRFQKINQEAALLKINGTPRGATPEFRKIREGFRAMAPAKSMAQIAQDAERGVRYNNGQPGADTGGAPQGGDSGGMFGGEVALPSTTTKAYTNGPLSLQIPDNWKELPSQGSVTFAPEGGYNNNDITHGVMIGAKKGRGANLADTTSQYISELLQDNPHLKQVGQAQRVTVSGMQGLATRLAGQSQTTGKVEIVTIVTAPLQSGDLFYVAAVVPEADAAKYNTTFRNLINSIKLSK